GKYGGSRLQAVVGARRGLDCRDLPARRIGIDERPRDERLLAKRAHDSRTEVVAVDGEFPQAGRALNGLEHESGCELEFVGPTPFHSRRGRSAQGDSRAGANLLRSEMAERPQVTPGRRPMPPYHSLGKVPRKRHIEHRTQPGYRGEGIFYEEVV